MTATEQSDALKVFISNRDSSCDECRDELGRKAWITLAGARGALCLACADLDHLVFLPSGDAALTRRARKHSTLVAVVLKWSRARKRYERQGVLVEETALARAEQECLADGDARARRQAREAERRAELDRAYVERFAQRVRELFPGCPAGRELGSPSTPAASTAAVSGRSAAAKRFDEEAVGLAVVAHVRHTETRYDDLLARGYEQRDARAEVDDTVRDVLRRWRSDLSHTLEAARKHCS
jgi:hypothetical protein